MHKTIEQIPEQIAQTGDSVVQGLAGGEEFQRIDMEASLNTAIAAIPGLRYASQARFDGNSGRSECAPSTRVQVLTTVYRWIRLNADADDSTTNPPLIDIPPRVPILWINGLAGSGKSTLAQTIARWCDDTRCLGASFFCARFGDRNNVQLIFPTISLQLALSNPTFFDAVSKSIRAYPDIHLSLVSHQLKKLIVEPLRSAAAEAPFPERVIVIDALDECKDDSAISVILSALSEFVEELHPLKFIVTSRPIDRIVRGFQETGLPKHTHSFPLSSVPPEVVSRDIHTFLQSRLARTGKYYEYTDNWPGEERVAKLVDMASGLFIFAATAAKFIDDATVNNPEQQLEALLNAVVDPSIGGTSPFAHLDALYAEVLQAAFPREVDIGTVAKLKLILGSIVLLRDQLSPTELDALFQLTRGTTRVTLRQLYAILFVPTVDSAVISIIHPSFPDFLMDPSRCTHSQFTVRPPLQHVLVAKRCLQILNHHLKRNPCGIEDTSLLNSEIQDLSSRVLQHIPPHVQYASRYWSYHLCNGCVDEELLALLESLCKTHLLHWLEVLSLIGDVDVAVEALQTARNVVQVRMQGGHEEALF